MNSWREICEELLWITGLTHPSYLSTKTIKSYLETLPEIAQMIPIGEIHIGKQELSLPDGDVCSGQWAFQLWKTSGVAVYTWDIGKISITIHTCKPLNYKRVLHFTLQHFHITDSDYYYLDNQGNYMEQRSGTFKR